MADEATKTPSSTDSYIGSLISLTSKSEIRYEGILYSINTEESSIGLRNVRSFGTEGRKKDGPQVAPSDKIYEYILFRGSDVKDLQVKSSPPVQAVGSSIDNDPAIIQSHYPLTASTSTNLPPAVSASSDVNLHAPQLGHPGSSFQGALPLYQPGGTLGPWGPAPAPGGNGGGLTMPMYWPGFYGPPNGLPHLPQQSLLRPPPGLSVPPSLQQQMQYSGFNSSLSAVATNLPGSKLPDIPPSLVTSSSSSTVSTSVSLPQLHLPPMPSNHLASETLSSSAVPKALNSVLSKPTFPIISPLAIPVPDAGSIAPAASDKSNAVPSSSLPILGISQTTSSVISSSAPSHPDAPTPSLLTPDHLQSGQTPTSAPASEVADKDVEVVQVSSSSSSEPKVPAAKEARPPILPLPQASKAFRKPNNGASFHQRHSYNYRGHGRGRGKGRGSGVICSFCLLAVQLLLYFFCLFESVLHCFYGEMGSRAVARFTEDFDFTAMNEKFKKEEIWGQLGKSKKDKEGNDGGDGSEDEVEEELPQIDVKPVYKKDNFFDTLSCNTVDQDSQSGRTRFSEQLKIDAETFGEFVRYRGGRGGRGPGHGGRGRGSYYGRGYGYSGRGRGRAVSARAS